MSAGSEGAGSARDLRLDFFRGIGMFIILIAHIPGNPWINWIPARFGFSDATEIFVFCSGMASAYAFASVFDRHGGWMGAARILLRVWQVWWTQIGVFVAVMVVLIAADRLYVTDAYTRNLQLDRFFADPASGMLGLVTLTYVPIYFDILPMYLVILMLIPVMVTIARHAGPSWALALSVAIWAAAQTRLTALPADPWVYRPWFFDPFGWQLVFFTGFAFIRGWLPAPPRSERLVILCACVLVASIPFAWLPLFRAVPILQAAHDLLLPLTDKTRFGLLRYLHFLALAYLAWLLVGPAGSRLRGALVEVAVAVGRQSLAVFVTGLVTAQILGIVLDRVGAGPVVTVLVNVLGMAVLVAAAYAVGWYKSVPWRQRRGTSEPARAAEPVAVLSRPVR
ncbi:MAG TPA: OpgC domain-containing protein [Geminicoccus sp.]|jgi:hypothetical protein|uniref:OpgC family protein n=1 Tax=Geminicoccus sp. TaxID=2024832 RepID=UPI002E33D06C|nr:OpgC domain-containing protein [Geminicoccus sp.]HEX2526857.1 OpgC domain-containing protein [Geminicoccus sp.]